MIAGRVVDASRVLGAPENWTPDQPPCCGLPVRDETISGLPAMTSSWQPTPAELAAIALGAPIHLTVIGLQHPPVALSVGEQP